MEYFSKLDNKSFSTKEALINHLLANYAMETEESNHGYIINAIKVKVPYVSVNSINKNKNGVLTVSVTYHNKQDDYLDGEEIIVTNGLTYNYHDYYDQMVCENVDELISYVSSYYNKADSIEKMLIDKFNIEKDSFTLSHIYTGGHDSNSSLNFEFTVDGVKYERRYEFGDSDDELFNQVNSLFTKELEGVIENQWDSCSHSQIFKVSGVDVSEFLKHGKKVRIEILD